MRQEIDDAIFDLPFGQALQEFIEIYKKKNKIIIFDIIRELEAEKLSWLLEFMRKENDRIWDKIDWAAWEIKLKTLWHWGSSLETERTIKW